VKQKRIEQDGENGKDERDPADSSRILPILPILFNLCVFTLRQGMEQTTPTQEAPGWEESASPA
jgi:hypothetical protein